MWDGFGSLYALQKIVLNHIVQVFIVSSHIWKKSECALSYMFSVFHSFAHTDNIKYSCDGCKISAREPVTQPAQP